MLEPCLVAEELPERDRPRREPELRQVARDWLVERDEAVLDEREDERRDERLRHGRDAEELLGLDVSGGARRPSTVLRDPERDSRHGCRLDRRTGLVL